MRQRVCWECGTLGRRVSVYCVNIIHPLLWEAALCEYCRCWTPHVAYNWFHLLVGGWGGLLGIHGCFLAVCNCQNRHLRECCLVFCRRETLVLVYCSFGLFRMTLADLWPSLARFLSAAELIQYRGGAVRERVWYCYLYQWVVPGTSHALAACAMFRNRVGWLIY